MNIYGTRALFTPRINLLKNNAKFQINLLTEDKEHVSDIKALKKGKDMMHSRILACSILVKEDIFLSGVVAAAMKKKASYCI